MAWLTGWTYRKAIVIAHTDDGAQTNYQLKLLVGESSGASGEQVDCGGHVVSDFDDLRFTTSDGSTLCDYWIESITGSSPNQLATVWIEVPSIAAHPNDTTIYMYYGGTETAVSNGANTFPFFDDFNRADSSDVGNGWTEYTNIFSISSNTLQGTASSDAPAYPGNSVYKGYTWSGKKMLEARYKSSSVVSYYVMFDGQVTATTILAWSLGTSSKAWYLGPSGWNQSDSISGSTYYILGIMWDDSAGTGNYYINRAAKATGISPLSISASERVAFRVYNTGPTVNADWVLIREYTANEPTWSSFGSEEFPGVSPSGIASTLAVGTPKITLYLKSSYIAGTAAFGTLKFTLYLKPSGIASMLDFGNPAVMQGSNIAPPGMAPTLTLGTPTLIYNQVITTAPRVPASTFGTPSVYQGNIAAIGVASIAAVGTPTVSRFVFHIILSATYSVEAPDVNRTYVVGSDAAGAQVSGSAITQADVDLVGERMEAHHNPAIPTATVAAAVATAQLAKARLDGTRAQITVAPHCGVELWDVVNVTDDIANQASSYRVSGYVLDFRAGVYRHILELCAL